MLEVVYIGVGEERAFYIEEKLRSQLLRGSEVGRVGGVQVGESFVVMRLFFRLFQVVVGKFVSFVSRRYRDGRNIGGFDENMRGKILKVKLEFVCYWFLYYLFFKWRDINKKCLEIVILGFIIKFSNGCRYNLNNVVIVYCYWIIGFQGNRQVLIQGLER